MKKLSDYRDDDALDLLADIMEPAAAIMADPDVRAAFGEGSRIRGASVAIKRHKPEVIQILARLDGVAVEDYHCDVFTLPGVVLEVLSDKELLSFFTARARTGNTPAPSGAATEPTGADAPEPA